MPSNMKRFAIILSLLFVCLTTISAKDVSQVRIYLNAGHGSWGPNDRPMETIPYRYLPTTGRPDTCGFYESNTNLWKVLKLGAKLESAGFKKENIMYSRVKNGPFPYVSGAPDESKYNRNLSEICEEVEANNFDLFLSVHSNATTEGSTSNYPLFIYRGIDGGQAGDNNPGFAEAYRAQQSYNFGKTVWPFIYSNGIDPQSLFSPTNPYIKGDITFYGSGSYRTSAVSGNRYYGYLGVLKHGAVGMLSEGYFHTYQPARHRALNKDYCGQEGVRYFRGIANWFGATPETKGYIMGTVKDMHEKIVHSLFKYAANTNDQWLPLNGAVVSLYKDGSLIKTYTVDNNYNGVFVFEDLEPGEYTLDATLDNYKALEDKYKTVVVKANETTYPMIYLENEHYEPPVNYKRIYAYDLSAQSTANGYSITYRVNAPAQEAKLVLTKQGTQDVTELSIDAPTEEGVVNTITLKNGDIASGSYNWGIWVKSVAVPTISNKAIDTFTNSRGIVINTNPETDHFGTCYVLDRIASNDCNVSTYTPTDQVIKKAVKHTEWGSIARSSILPDGTVLVADWSDAKSGVWKLNPDDITASTQNFFIGTRNSDGLISNGGVAVAGSTPGIAVTGSGNSTKLTIYNEEAGNNLCEYNIGEEKSWDKAPSKQITLVAQANTNGNVVPCKGGYFVSQLRAKGNNSSQAPSLIYVDSNGSVTYNSSINPDVDFDGSLNGGFIISPDGSTLIISNASNKLVIFSLSWTGTTPKLTKTGTFESSLQPYQFAWDYAGNLYGSNGTSEVFTFPTNDNSCTTPAKSGLVLTLTSGINDAENDNTFVLQPNPVSDVLHIQSSIAITSVDIVGANGAKVLTATDNDIDMSRLAAGIYFVTINKSRVYKIIKK